MDFYGYTVKGKICMWFLVIGMLVGALLTMHKTDRDVAEVIALTILGEARGEGKDGMLAVAQVILNRSRDRGIPCFEVCLQPKQFSFWNKPPSTQKRKALLESKEAITAMDAAWKICRDKDVGIKLVKTSKHYYNPKLCSPQWRTAFKHRIEVGNHLFLYN